MHNSNSEHIDNASIILPQCKSEADDTFVSPVQLSTLILQASAYVCKAPGNLYMMNIVYANCTKIGSELLDNLTVVSYTVEEYYDRRDKAGR